MPWFSKNTLQKLPGNRKLRAALFLLVLFSGISPGTLLAEEVSAGSLHSPFQYFKNPLSSFSKFFAGIGQAVNKGPDDFRVLWDNDTFLMGRSTDQFYTNGFRMELYFQGDIKTEKNAGKHQNRYGFFLGQNMYTPTDITIPDPPPYEQPYAGWIFGGYFKDVFSEDGRFTRYELNIGAIGPAAGAEPVQRFVHEVVGADEPMGWDTQIGSEPAILYHYEHRSRRWQLPGKNEDGTNPSTHNLDLAKIYGLNLGNILNDISVGLIFRAGKIYNRFNRKNGLPRNPDNYVFVRGDVKLVARNSLLQGGMFNNNSTHTVGIRPIVTKLEAGAAIEYRRISIIYSVVLVSPKIHPGTRELTEVLDYRHKYGSFNFSLYRKF